MLRSWLAVVSRRLALALHRISERMVEAPPSPKELPAGDATNESPPEVWLQFVASRSPELAARYRGKSGKPRIQLGKIQAEESTQPLVVLPRLSEPVTRPTALSQSPTPAATAARPVRVPPEISAFVPDAPVLSTTLPHAPVGPTSPVEGKSRSAEPLVSGPAMSTPGRPKPLIAGSDPADSLRLTSKRRGVRLSRVEEQQPARLTSPQAAVGRNAMSPDFVRPRSSQVAAAAAPVAPPRPAQETSVSSRGRNLTDASESSRISERDQGVTKKSIPEPVEQAPRSLDRFVDFAPYAPRWAANAPATREARLQPTALTSTQRIPVGAQKAAPSDDEGVRTGSWASLPPEASPRTGESASREILEEQARSLWLERDQRG